MVRNRGFALIFVAMLLSPAAYAGNSVPLFLPFQGRATDSSGNPISSPPAVTMKFRIYAPTAASGCYLYEDTQSVSPNGYGFFSVIIGTLGNRTGPAVALEAIFSNEANLTDSCAATYTPSTGDWRKLEVVINGTALPSMQTIAASAYSLNAHMLDGKTSSGYIQTAGSVTQANMMTLVGTGDASSLHHHNSLYATLSGNNSLSGNVTTTGSFYGSAAGSTIGIGTTSAGADIDIRKTSPSILLGATSGGGGTPTITFTSGATQRAQIRASETTNELRFYTGTTQALLLDANQNMSLTGSLLVGGTTNLGQYTNVQETTLVSGLGVANAGSMWFNTDTGNFKFWNGSTAIGLGAGSFVTSVSPGTGISNTGTSISPTLNVIYGTGAGTAVEGNASFGGDVSGSYNSLKVTRLQGYPVNATAPGSGQVLTWNGSAWTPASVADTSLSTNVALKNAANVFTAANSIQVPTTTTTALVLQTTDDNTANNLLSIRNQAGTAIATVRADAVPTTATDLTPKSYVDTQILGRLPLSGGALTGPLTMGGNSITGLQDPTNAQDAATKNYADTHLGSRTMSIVAPSSGQVVGWNGSAWLPVAVNAVQIQSRPISGSAPTSMQVLKWNGSQWEPAADSDAGGDVTSVSAGTGLSGGGLFGDVTLTLSDTAVTVGTYGSATQISQFSVDQQGRLFAAGSIPIAVNTTGLNQSGATNGQTLKWNGSAWLPGTDLGITALTGDVSATGTGSVTATIGDNRVTSSKLSTTGIGINRLVISDATTGTSLGFASCGVDGQVLKYSTASGWACAADVGAGGIVTSISTGTGLSGGPITSAGTISLADTTVTVGTYGSASSVGQFSVDKQGRLYAASSVAITVNTTALNQTGAASGQVLSWNGSAWLPAAPSIGDITDVAVGTGLTGGGTSGSVTVSLNNTTVAANSYGSPSQVATFTVDQQGRLTVAGNQNINIAATAITQTGAGVGQVLKWNGSAWLPATDVGAGGIVTSIATGTGLSGGPITSDGTISLANTTVSAGSFGSAFQIPQFTVDQQGRLTQAANIAIAINPTAINQYAATAGQVLKWNGSAWLPAADTDTNSGGDITDVAVGTGLTGGGTSGSVTVSLNNTAVTTGSYGSASQVAAITVDQQGRLTAAVNKNIAINPTAINQYAATSGQTLKWNGSAWLPGTDLGITALTGDVSATGTGSVTATIGNNKVTASKLSTTGIGINRLVISDATTGTSLGFASCGVDGQILKYSSAGGWACATDVGASGIVTSISTGTGLSGGPITSTGTISLANTTVSVGSFGSAFQVPQFTVDQQGRLTQAANIAIAINPTAINQYAATVGQVLKWNGSAWLPAADTDSGGDITDVAVGTGLTGGGTSGSVTVSLNNTAVTTGSYGSPSQVAMFTVDQQGRLTAAINQDINIAATAITQTGAGVGQVLKWNGSAWLPAADTDTNSGGDITDVAVGTGLTGGGTSGSVTVSLNNTTVAANSYGSPSQVATFIVDQQGRLTGASSQNIAINPTAINQYAATAGQILKWNGSAWLPGTDLGITALTGDVSATGTGSVTATIGDNRVTSSKLSTTGIGINRLVISDATTGTSLGFASCGVDGQVLKYSTAGGWACSNDAGASGVLTQIDTGTGLSGGPINTAGTISLADTTVTVGTYGSASSVGQFSVDKQGRLFAASSVPVAINPTAINQYAATAGQVLKWNGSAWLPAADTDTNSGGDITDVAVGTGLTGGGTSGTVTVSLTSTAVTPNSYGSPSQVSTFTVDQQGRLTAAANQTINIAATAITQTGAGVGQVLKWNGSAWLPASATAGSVTNIATGTGLSGGPITSTGTISLADTTVSAGSFGSAFQIPQFTVDQQGRLTQAASIAIAINPTAINQYAATNGQVLSWNGSAWLPAAASAGDITDVAVGTGLTGGGTSGAVTVSLNNTAVVANSYGSPSQVSTFTVDQQGRLTGASSQNIAINPTAINQYAATSGQVLKWNGSAWLPGADTGGISALTGDVSATGTGSVTATIGDNRVTSSKLSTTGIGINRLVISDATTGTNLGFATCAVDGQVLKYSAAGGWACSNDAGASGVLTQIDTGTGLSGGPINTTGTISLANTAVTVGTYGSASSVGQFSVDQQGRLFAASSVPIALNTTALNQTGAASGQVLSWNGSAWLPAAASAGDITDVAVGTGLTGGGTSGAVTVSLTSTAVTPNSYGSPSQVSTFTVDQQGRLTGASSQNIAINPTAINQYAATSGQVLKWNGSAWLPGADTGGISALTGDVSATGTGSVTATIGDNKVTASKLSTTGIGINRLVISDATTGTNLGFATCAVDGQVLKYSTAGGWACSNDAGASGVLTQIDTGTGLSGGPINTAGTISLANTAVTVGTYGSASSVGQFSVDQQGRLFAASSVPIALNTTALNQTGAASGQVLSWNGSAWLPAAASAGDITDVAVGTGLTGGGTSGAVTVSLNNTAVTTGSYGSASQVSTFTVDQQGRLTGASSQNIAINPTAINQYAATSGQVLKWNGSAWLPASATAGSVTNIATGTGLSGGPITSTGTISLANTTVTVGTYGSASSVGQFSVDQQGRLFAASSVAIALNTTALNQTGAASGQVLSWNGLAWLPAAASAGDITDVAAGTGLTGGGPSGAVTVSLNNTAVTIGSYGSPSQVAAITVDQQGRLTGASSQNIAINPTAINQYAATSGQVLKWNGSAWLPGADTGGISALTGDVSATGTGSVTATIGDNKVTASKLSTTGIGINRLVISDATTGTNLGFATCGVDGQVLKYSAAGGWACAGDSDSGDITSVVAGTGLSGGATSNAATISLANTAVTVGTYGSASSVGQFSVDQQGRLFAASSVPIAVNPTAINQYSASANQVLMWNGSSWLPTTITSLSSVVSIISTGNLSVSSASGSTLTLGNSGASSVLSLNSPTVNVGGNVTTTVNVGSTPLTTLALGNAATGALTTTLGSTASTSSTTVQSGTGGTTISSAGTTTSAVSLTASGAGGGVTLTPGAGGSVVISSGNLGIGSTVPVQKLDVLGSAAISGSVTASAFFYSSDRRLKTDIRPVEGLSGILKLNGVRFKWRSDLSDDVGLIAQEVEEVYPELVAVNPSSGYKTVKYGNLVGPLIESTKELYGICRASETQWRSLASLVDKNKRETDLRIDRLEQMLKQVMKENAELRRKLR